MIAGAAPASPLRLIVRLTPRGGRDAVEGWARGADGQAYLKVRVAAPPVDGAANAALAALIARQLKSRGATVRIVAGAQGRLKHLEIEGADPSALRAAFGAPDQSVIVGGGTPET